MNTATWLKASPKLAALFLAASLALSACSGDDVALKSHFDTGHQADAGDSDGSGGDSDGSGGDSDGSGGDSDGSGGDSDGSGGDLDGSGGDSDGSGGDLDGSGGDSDGSGGDSDGSGGDSDGSGGDSDGSGGDSDGSGGDSDGSGGDSDGSGGDECYESGSEIGQDCALQEGVCAGTQTTTCDGVDYAACTEVEYGSDYNSDPEEGRVCDGLDNNCDGIVDNACCGVGANDAEPTAETLGNASNRVAYQNIGPHSPTVIDAAAGAPAGATSLVVWLEEDESTLAAQHIDRDGKPVGDKYTREADTAAPITAVTTPQGYEIIWGDNAGPLGTIRRHVYVQPVSPTLSPVGASVQLFRSGLSSDKLNQITAAYQDGAVLVGIVDKVGGLVTKPKVAGIHYRVNDRPNSINILNLDVGEPRTNATVRAFALDNGLLLTWNLVPNSSGATTTRFAGNLYDSAGVATGSFTTSNADQLTGDFDIVQTGANEVLAVFPEKRFSNRVLVASTINLATNTIGTKVVLTDAINDSVAPALAGRDTDSDGYVDQTTIAWVSKSNTETNLVASSFDAQNPALIADMSTVASNQSNLDNAEVAITDTNAVTVWQTRTGTQQVKTAAVTLDGNALCLD
ncbi:hypothetical protein [Bradymonas sediminis]|uniref:hypothetical protein n=1 Tax=Bradymonas sediminis TaxID=1548548 RepID=UPI0010E701AC|nr:hypothetical protein [Bradymonas sediminis]TDP71881.1 hypothetical protein DFR33_10895 [Bradymonas sediminis]